MATNKLIDLSRLSRFWDKVKNYIDSKITNLPAAQGGTDNTLVTTGDKYNWNNNDASNKVSKSGDTMTGDLTMQGFDIIFGVRTGTEDSSDLVWKNGSNGEKMRIWSPNSPTAIQGPNFRIYKDDGTSLFSGQLALGEANGWAKGANLLNSRATIGTSSQNHAQALQSYFNSYKASTPRNCGINFYSGAYGNGALAFGYFLNGYDSTPYGGFFVCHYNNPRYVGIQNGTYTQQELITSSNIGSQTVSKAGTCTGNAATATTASSCSGNSATATKSSYATLNYLGYTSGTTAKNFSYTTSLVSEIVLCARHSSKIFSGIVPTNLLASTNQEVWLTGGRGGGTSAVNSDSARALLNIRISATTGTTTQITIQGITSNNQGVDTTASTYWYCYVR